MGPEKQRGNQVHSIFGGGFMITMDKMSRTKKKKAAQALQKLGEQLVHLSDAQFALLDLPKDLMEAVAMARQIKQHEARRRQLQYIGKLMRNFDPAVVEAAIEKIRAGESEIKRQFKLVERWRDELVGGDKERLTWLIEKYPAINPDELNQLVSNARGEQAQIKPKKAGRVLFRYLSALE
jgi:ribosome-associated protein